MRVKKKMLEMRQIATVQLFPAPFCHPLAFFSSLELAVFSRAVHHLIFLWLQTLKKFSLAFPNHFFSFRNADVWGVESTANRGIIALRELRQTVKRGTSIYNSGYRPLRKVRKRVLNECQAERKPATFLK